MWIKNHNRVPVLRGLIIRRRRTDCVALSFPWNLRNTVNKLMKTLTFLLPFCTIIELRAAPPCVALKLENVSLHAKDVMLMNKVRYLQENST